VAGEAGERLLELGAQGLRRPELFDGEGARAVECNGGWRHGVHLRNIQGFEREPVEGVRPERQKQRGLTEHGKRLAPEELDRRQASVLFHVELDVLRRARKIRDDEQALVTVPAHERKHLGVVGVEDLDVAPSENLVCFAQIDQALHPPQQ
jgi:hypothetical protein